MCQAAGRVMLSQRSGKVINIGSLTNTLGLGGISIYGMAKAGLGQLTRTLAVEWAPSNIQVNCIIPGFFQTQMTQEVWCDERRVDWLESHIPMRRGGQPDELGGLAVLLSGPSSTYITGQSFAVDGGVLAGSPGYEA
jgi:NAD(P)-dependent dehydrogenase (short-subunit alcohol dehydrogenase family)